MPTIRFSVIFSLQSFVFVGCQLAVNVKDNGGDVYRETIDANTTDDTVSLEFSKADGTLATQFIDGRNEIQIFKVVILPEEERGQTRVQTLCFVSRFGRSEFISSDAMSKLRQKNPSAIRHPEETRPLEILKMDLVLNVSSSHVLSPNIATLCADAKETTFMLDDNLRLLSQILNRDYKVLLGATRSAPIDGITLCWTQLEPLQPCVCRYDLCIGWYPCGLKYCHGKDSANRVVSYRCGIKTCSRCRSFEFLAGKKSLCIWDEPDFSFDEAGASSDTNKVRVASRSSAVTPLDTVAERGLERFNGVQGVLDASTAKTVNGNHLVLKMVQKLNETRNNFQEQPIIAANKSNTLEKNALVDVGDDK